MFTGDLDGIGTIMPLSAQSRSSDRGGESPLSGSDVSVIVPAFNEQDGIIAVLEDLKQALPTSEIIVVDDGSTDRTLDGIRDMGGIRVLQHAFNRGYGAALKTGMRAAQRDIIAWFDSDHQHRAQDLVMMIDRLRREKLAAVIGIRRKPSPSLIRFAGKWVIRTLARTLRAKTITDLNCGLRAFRRDAILRYLPILPDRFSASMTSTMILLERGYPLAFQEVELNPRLGTSKVVLRDGFSALILVLRMVMLVAPMRIFVRFGALALLLGGLYGTYKLIAFESSFPTSAVVVCLLGALSCMLGLIADQISQSRLNALDISGVLSTSAIGFDETSRESLNKSGTNVSTL